MFWESFFANLLSDLIAGALIGTIIAIWISKRQAASEREHNERDQIINDLRRGKQYLRILRDEINSLMEALPQRHKDFMETGWGREIRLETPMWDIVERSGELPRLLHPNMVEYLARFYHEISYARRGRDLLIESWLVPSPRNVPGMQEKQTAFISMVDTSISNALEIGAKLIDHVKDNLTVLSDQIRILKHLDEKGNSNAT